MKKLMMAAVALISMTMMSISLTACGGDDDSSKPKDQIEYFVEGSLGYRIPDKTQADPIPESWGGILGGSGPLADYNDAIATVAPSPNYEDRDVAIKNACDEVYNKHQNLKGIVLKGSVKVTKKCGSIITEVWTKTYE